MTNCKRYKVAAIDLGTVSSRLVLAQVEAGAIVESSKHTEITDLGEGVDATGRFCEAAVERVLDACRMFVDEARAFGAACVCTTCTSAARDASNAALLLDGLRELGLKPQVIPGEVEARLTFFGVAHDFAGERIIVADSGGGSTELATGVYAPERSVFALEGTRSLDIGCRRVTERFFSALPPADGEFAAAAAWAGEQFAAYFEGLPVDFERAERLVAVGGTVTTLVALVHELEPYDSSFVHLRELSLEQVSAAIERMSTLDVEGIAALPGVQPKRAGVILAGAVVIRELMRVGGYKTLTVSENSLLAGMAATINETLDGATPTIAWTPSLSTLQYVAVKYGLKSPFRAPNSPYSTATQQPAPGDVPFLPAPGDSPWVDMSSHKSPVPN